MKNQSIEIEFILLGLTEDPRLQIVIFFFFFLNYMLSLMENFIIIILTLLDPCFKSPMYFFLPNFSFLEISFTTVCILLSFKTSLKFPSAQQRANAFSTCSSWMVVISISYGGCSFMYMKPSPKERVTLTKGVTVLDTSIAPLLNPFVYNLRNQQVKEVLKDMLQTFCYFQHNDPKF